MELWDGYKWRQEEEENRCAYFVSHLINIEGKSVKKPVTPADILKPLRQNEVKQNKSEDAKYLQQLFKNRLENLGGG